MGHPSTVFGAILLHHNFAAFPDAEASNARVLSQLPESDEWPFLVRSMFSLTQSTQVPVNYKYRVLHFGASMKALEWEWAEWLGSSRPCWPSCRVTRPR